MRAVRAVSLTAALVLALMGSSAAGAMAAGQKAKGSITVQNQGTLSFHASQPSGGGFEITNSPYGTLVGNVTCYVPGTSSGGTKTAAFTGVITKGPSTGKYYTVYLEDATSGDARSGDTFIVEDRNTTMNPGCPVARDLTPTPATSTGYIEIR